MAFDEESKVDTSRLPEQSAPSSDESTTTIDAEPTIPTGIEGDLSKEQQGIRKHLIALSIVLCQLVVVCGSSGFHSQRVSIFNSLENYIGFSFWFRPFDLIYDSPRVGI